MRECERFAILISRALLRDAAYFPSTLPPLPPSNSLLTSLFSPWDDLPPLVIRYSRPPGVCYMCARARARVYTYIHCTQQTRISYTLARASVVTVLARNAPASVVEGAVRASISNNFASVALSIERRTGEVGGG